MLYACRVEMLARQLDVEDALKGSLNLAQLKWTRRLAVWDKDPKAKKKQTTQGPRNSRLTLCSLDKLVFKPSHESNGVSMYNHSKFFAWLQKLALLATFPLYKFWLCATGSRAASASGLEQGQHQPEKKQKVRRLHEAFLFHHDRAWSMNKSTTWVFSVPVHRLFMLSDLGVPGSASPWVFIS